MHGWLPTYDRLYREQQSPNPQCPLCKNLVEDNLHLFTCKHPQQQEIILTLHKRLESDNTNYGVDTLIHNITMAISRIGQTWMPPHTDEEALNSCLQDQTRIGWKQMLFGRISCTMSAYIGLYLREKGVERWQNSGEKLTIRIIQNVWDTFLKLWRNRNTLIYDSQAQSKENIQKERLHIKVARYYQYADKLTVMDQQKLFLKDKETLMLEEPRYINAWLKLAGRIIRASKKESSKMYREQILMDRFFSWNPINKTRKRKLRGRNHKEDLKPD